MKTCRIPSAVAGENNLTLLTRYLDFGSSLSQVLLQEWYTKIPLRSGINHLKKIVHLWKIVHHSARRNIGNGAVSMRFRKGKLKEKEI